MGAVGSDLQTIVAPAALLSGLILGLLWALHLRFRNLGLADVGWTAAIGGCALLHACAGGGWPARRLLAASLGLAWSLRLGAHLVARLRRDPAEDPRYARIRRSWGRRHGVFSAGFFALQGALAALLSAPYFFICRNPREGFGVVEAVGVVVWAAALWGESASDAQLSRYRLEASNHGQTCRRGWWALSRHPNYFFEWLTWVGLSILAWASPGGWAASFAPVLMLWLLLGVSGVPPAEERSLASRPESYRAYQREVSVFVPWFPRKHS